LERKKLKIGSESSPVYSINAGILATSLAGLSPMIPLNLSLSMSVASLTARNVVPDKQPSFDSF
jgi:hypothetical protein